MKFWIKEDQCSGCGACSNKCPKDAIELKWDENGYSLPLIDNNLCIDCGLCEKACTIFKCDHDTPFAAEPKRLEPTIYAAWSRTYETRYNSTSGGVFSELAKAALKEGAYISGAVYDESQMVHHEVTNTVEGLDRIRQSKYTQSETGNVFRDIRKLLYSGEKVVYCGAPCQVAGLYEFLGNDHENLTTVDFICRGINSPLAYRAFLDELEEIYGAKATRVWFKNKEKGWNTFSTRIDFANGKYYRKTRYEDLYMRGYLQYNLFIRPSCTDCEFKGLPRMGDITLADFWKIEKELDADLGTSMVIVNSKKGDELFQKARYNLMVYERTYEEAVKGNLCLTQSVRPGIHSEEFMNLLKNGVSFSRAFYKVTGELPKVSIIIPIDSESKYLPQSLESILRQSCKQMEVLLIPVSCDLKLQKYVESLAQRKTQVLVLPPTLGITEALNNAILASTGEYIHICTGREVMYEGFYESIIKEMMQSHSDIACFGWHDAKKQARSQNAFNGSGNTRAFLELCLTESDESSDYRGYGIHLWNKIFRKDSLFIDEQLLEFKEEGYAMQNLFWLIRLSFLINKVIFTSKTMMYRMISISDYNKSQIMVINPYFEEVRQILYILEGIEPYAYEVLKKLLYQYEVSLISYFQKSNNPRRAEQIEQHATEFLNPIFNEVDLLKNELLIIDLKSNIDRKDKEIIRLRKDRTFLKNKVNDLLEQEKKLRELKLHLSSKDKKIVNLKNQLLDSHKVITELEVNVDYKDGLILDLKNQLQGQDKIIEGLKKDRVFLKNKVNSLMDKLELFEDSIFARIGLRIQQICCSTYWRIRIILSRKSS